MNGCFWCFGKGKLPLSDEPCPACGGKEAVELTKDSWDELCRRYHAMEAALRQIKEAEDGREAALRASHDWMLLRWGEQISPELGRCLDRNKHALAAPLARDIADRALKEMEG